MDLSIAGCERIKDEDLCKLVGQSGAVDLQRSGGPHWQGGRAAAFGGGERHAVGNLARHHRVARGVTSLTKLDVSACGDVRARGLRAIAEKCILVIPATPWLQKQSKAHMAAMVDDVEGAMSRAMLEAMTGGRAPAEPDEEDIALAHANAQRGSSS